MISKYSVIVKSFAFEVPSYLRAQHAEHNCGCEMRIGHLFSAPRMCWHH